ncbi:hypothetical protein [Caballeronia telluris]|uniref:Signal peptide protein n=1 Tax=Caballeronia telluris TaxID=326475 RepID=A0A158F101_9BURK|nr:hypothetical protein [Caballeronia telluris]SAL13441.1 signal peptide protein [Caballeronia telluris]
MRSTYWVSMLAATVALSGCGTSFMSLPAQPVADQATMPDAKVALYLKSQAHPAVVKVIGRVEHSVRIARNTDDSATACRRAFAEGLQKLRVNAQDRNANAVVNIRTSFHANDPEMATDFACGVSPSAASLKVAGDLVVIGAR